MARLYVFAEGQTEKTFADNVLGPHLANLGVFLQGATAIRTSEKKGVVYRGGGRSYQRMRNHITHLLDQEQGRDAFFTTMIDLYGIQSGFPRLDEANKLRHLPEKRVQFLEQAFAEDVGDTRRFFPYIQLHEYEAYLFSDPRCFRKFYIRCEKEIAELHAIAARRDTPELIDDDPNSAPSKRILALFPDYQKRLMGVQIAEAIGLYNIRANCPHFNGWLERLEGLGK